MTRPLIAAACALVLAACGGKKEEDPGNRAASATFTYGAPSAASATQAGALASSVAASAGFTTAPNADGAYLLADPSSVTSALLGASGFGFASVGPGTLQAFSAGEPRIGPLATTAPAFDNPSCVVTTATGVTLNGCTMTVDEVSGATTIHAVLTASGSIGYTAASHTLAWDVRVGESVTMSGDVSLTGNASVHMAGSLTVTATTIVGHMASELAVTASANGQSMSAGVDESVDIDVTYADAATCATRVVGGTVEARRVWTARPQGATAADLPDLGVKVTWTGCGTATVQYGTR